jgi:hypothetical protein
LRQKRGDIELRLDALYGDARTSIKTTVTAIDQLLEKPMANPNELQHQSRLLDAALKQADQLIADTDPADLETKRVQSLKKTAEAARALRPKIEIKGKLVETLGKQKITVDATLDKLKQLLEIVGARGLRTVEQAGEDIKLLTVGFFSLF